MILRSVYIRFYKSFNYDNTRKLDLDDKSKSIHPMPWEYVNDKFYPHIKIPIDSQITTVVGANESGKSHLLDAILLGVGGENEKKKIKQKDFCRYSQFFNSVDSNIPKYPEFGFEWIDLSLKDQETLRDLCVSKDKNIDLNYEHFFFFRIKEKIKIYIPILGQKPATNSENIIENIEEQSDLESDNVNNIQVQPENSDNTLINDVSSLLTARKVEEFELESIPENFLPNVFQIDSDIALPDRVTLTDLLEGRKKLDDPYEVYNRLANVLISQNSRKLKALMKEISEIQVNEQKIGSINASLISKSKDLLEEVFVKTKRDLDDDEQLAANKAFNLVYDLLFEIAGISKDDIKNLTEALKNGETGFIRSIINKINKALEDKLRFPSIWSQDKTFALTVEPTENELSFVIRDRTGCQYSFDERSGGLKHFLSYYIQYLTHQPPKEAETEILLMDEPDAYLSGEAQQDLLKIFQKFADPTSPGRNKVGIPVQVIYVTHSPFLIDKNHSERVRALEKPEGTNGTRVLPGPTQNRYEPLRSAFGAFLGETTFMSQCNLMVEGPADQILLAGATNFLRNKVENIPESELLDLNKITIVACDGAPNVPYTVFSATSNRAEKPALIVLLDSDKSGNKAKADLTKDGPHPNKKAILDSKFIIQLGDITLEEIGLTGDSGKDERPFVVLEDLVPITLSIRVIKRFLKIFFDVADERTANLTEENVRNNKIENKSNFEILQKLVREIEPQGAYSIDKVPFAKTLVEFLPLLTDRTDDESVKTELIDFTANIRSLLRKLRAIQDLAEEDIKEKNQRKKVKEAVDTFLSDYKDTKQAKCDDVSRLLYKIENELEGDQKERNYILEKLEEIRVDHRLKENPIELVKNFDSLVVTLEMIKEAKTRAYEKSS